MHFCVFLIVCELLQPFRKILANGRLNLDPPESASSHLISSFCFGFGLLGLSRSSFLKPDRHVAQRLDLMRTSPAVGDVEDELVPESADNLGATQVYPCFFFF